MNNRLLSLLLAAVLTLSVGLIGCTSEVPETTRYTLTISSTDGGQVTRPGEGIHTYDGGTRVNLVAVAEGGYQFAAWTGDVSTIADIEDATTTMTMNGDYSIEATFAVKQYSLVIHSTEGGSVTTPGENAYTYDKGDMVSLVAVADEGYVFINWTGNVSTIADVGAASTTITMNGGCSVTANFVRGIWDWYDLDAIRNNLDGSYILMKDLDSTSDGYAELAAPLANGGSGWQPIGSVTGGTHHYGPLEGIGAFSGTLNGQQHRIEGLSINRSNDDGVGLFGLVSRAGVIENLGVVSAEVTGYGAVSVLAGCNYGTVSNSYSTGGVTRNDQFIGGLVGINYGTVRDCFSAVNVTTGAGIGGLVGKNCGTVSNSYSISSVVAEDDVGGLVGDNLYDIFYGTVTNSFWDLQMSGLSTSDGGTGKTTAEMKSITTFSGADWNIIAVANPGIRNSSYVWNIVDGQTYPFLSWQS